MASFLKYSADTAVAVLTPLALAICLATGCTPQPGPPAAPVIRFTDITGLAELNLVHRNGMTGNFLEAEIYAPGVALVDIDNDNDLDAYVVGGTLDAAAGDNRDRLFRNDLDVTGGAPEPRFVDVTAASGIDLRSYGMGVAAGDVDNDGRVDLYVTRLDANVLLHNNGNGTFTDVTRRSGVADAGSWSIAAAFVDIDRDGWLDLFVSNYLDYSVAMDVPCLSRAGAADYCDPSAYRPARSRLYRNRGDGTFDDVTTRALPGGGHGGTLGLSTADFNGDGWIDIYVANDRQENDLWINNGNGIFRNTALAAGAALNADGRAEASMGVDAGDFDNDGDEDLIIANFTSEGHTLYRNHGDGTFEDIGLASGIRPASLPYTGFGAAWLDADNDSWLDVLIVNGAVRVIEALSRVGDPFPLHQPKQLFRNSRNGRFDDVTARAGDPLRQSDVSRGAAFGDVDNDGDTDILIGNNNGPVRLLRNDSPPQSWFGARLVGAGGRDMLGARLSVSTGGRALLRRARTDGSFASANDPRVLAGLAGNSGNVSATVTWPAGSRETWGNLAPNRWHTLRQGTGIPVQ